ncbi:MAG: hypothetical protein WCW33_04785 [Candidatus Babeliales bacterium]
MNRLRNFFMVFLFCAGVSGLHAAQAELPHDVEIEQEGLKSDDWTIVHELAAVVDEIKNVFSTYISEHEKQLYAMKALENALSCSPAFIINAGLNPQQMRERFNNYVMAETLAGWNCPMPIPISKDKAPIVYGIVCELAQLLRCPMPLICIGSYKGDIENFSETAMDYFPGVGMGVLYLGCGMFKRLNDRSAKAVLAHELGHLKCYDCKKNNGFFEKNVITDSIVSMMEMEADRLALKSTIDPDAFIDSMHKLKRMNMEAGFDGTGSDQTHLSYASRITLAEKMKKILSKDSRIVASLCVQHANSRTSMF